MHVGTFYQLYGVLTVLDLIVLGMCVLSIYLTCCSLRRGYKLYRVCAKSLLLSQPHSHSNNMNDLITRYCTCYDNITH